MGYKIWYVIIWYMMKSYTILSFYEILFFKKNNYYSWWYFDCVLSFGIGEVLITSKFVFELHADKIHLVHVIPEHLVHVIPEHKCLKAFRFFFSGCRKNWNCTWTHTLYLPLHTWLNECLLCRLMMWTTYFSYASNNLFSLYHLGHTPNH